LALYHTNVTFVNIRITVQNYAAKHRPSAQKISVNH